MQSLKSAKNLIIVIVLTVVIAGFSGCQKKNVDTTTPATSTIDTNQTTTLAQATTTETKPDPVTITKDKDGWKTYTNTDWGIRFRFKDEGDEVEINSDNKQINFKNNKNHIYFYRSNTGSITSSGEILDHERTLYEAIVDMGWNTTQTDLKLLGIEKFTTKNGIKYYKVRVLTGSLYPETKTSESIRYYLDGYFKKSSDIQNRGNFNYIMVYNFEEQSNEAKKSQILDSLEFFN